VSRLSDQSDRGGRTGWDPPGVLHGEAIPQPESARLRSCRGRTESDFVRSQLATLAKLGEERTAQAGDVLYRVGATRCPFVAILDGEVAILDDAGNEIVRNGASRFTGELNLMSGQTVFVTAVVTKPLRYIAVERDALRTPLFEDATLRDLQLSTFIARRELLQTVAGIGLEIVGPRASEATMRMLDFARGNRLPYTWRDEPAAGTGPLPLARLPGRVELHGPTTGQLSRALGIGRELGRREEADLVVESTALGGQAGASRRIEHYLGFPAGISGSEQISRGLRVL